MLDTVSYRRQATLWGGDTQAGRDGRVGGTEPVETAPLSLPRRDGNQLQPDDRVAHDWYRFVLSFPPHLVREYLGRFGVDKTQRVLDPFCGTGTTLVECKKMGIASVGLEANPMTHFASEVKVDWSPDPDGLWEHAQKVAEAALAELGAYGIEDDPVFPNNGGTLKQRP